MTAQQKIKLGLHLMKKIRYYNTINIVMRSLQSERVHEVF